MIVKTVLASNIARYRRANDLTQEELGAKLGLTFQAVSKWETEQTMPAVETLLPLAKALQVSVDKLLGYDAPQKDAGYFDFDAAYKKEEYYGGINPSSACLKVLSLLPPDKHLKILDICCGEGRNAVFFARCGYEVSAFDLSDAGIEKTRQLAEKARVHVKVFKADICDYRLDCHYDIIFSNSAFHFIKPELRDEIIGDYREHTNIGGLNAFSVFVDKPFIISHPEFIKHSYLWRSGMLLTYYHDWKIEDFSEHVVGCASPQQYQETINQIYARKIL